MLKVRYQEFKEWVKGRDGWEKNHIAYAFEVDIDDYSDCSLFFNHNKELSCEYNDLRLYQLGFNYSEYAEINNEYDEPSIQIDEVCPTELLDELYAMFMAGLIEAVNE